MNKDRVLYGVVGLLVGVILTWGVVGARYNFDRDGMESGRMHGEKRIMNGEMTMSAMSDQLKNKTGDEFDKAFIEMMIEHHEGAIDMAELISGRAKHDEIKKLGEGIVSAQTKEINEMKEWAKSWGYTAIEESLNKMMQH